MNSLASAPINKPQRFPENLPPGWHSLLRNELQEEYFVKLLGFLKNEYKTGRNIFPRQENILRALQAVDYPDVKVVLLGQDPYHGKDQAIGLCFGVPNQLSPKPPSLLNIFKEIQSDLGLQMNPQESDLSGWANQGVLLLNTVLTVRQNQAFSHRDQGWEVFTDKIIRHLSDREDPIVFVLWGAAARKKRDLIDKHHYFLESPHPSPLSAHRGFFGSKPFSKANAILKKLGKDEIQWQKTCQ